MSKAIASFLISAADEISGLNHTLRRLTRGETANLIKRSDKEAREVTGRTAADRKLPRATIGKGGLSTSDPERYRA